MTSINAMIHKLYTLLSEELETREPYLTPRTRSEQDRRKRQGPSYKNTRYFISVLENHIMERTASVVFTIETSYDGYTLRFYKPLTAKEYDRVAASGYTPVLRSKVFLTVGLGKREDVTYAYCEIRMSQYSSLIDVFDALHMLGRELELYLANNKKK